MGVRIDQLLHWLCLARSRSLVARACQEGRIRLNDEKVKPAKEVRAGDRIAITEPARDLRRVIEILELPARQLSRKEAPSRYRVIEGLGVEAPGGFDTDLGDEDDG